MMNRALSAACLLLLAAAPARAVEFHHPEGPFVPTHHCTCRFDGQDLDVGVRRCLKTADGPRAAICSMEQNVTSWKQTGEGCPEASLPAPRS